MFFKWFESNRKPNKIWVSKGRSMKLSPQGNDIEIYSMHNDGKSLL